jgi:hypothetical protein
VQFTAGAGLPTMTRASTGERPMSRLALIISTMALAGTVGCGGREARGPLADVTVEAGMTASDAGGNETDASAESDAPTTDAGTDVSSESKVANAAGADASRDSSADGSACTPILPSDYDQSCALDSDCVAVGVVAMCPASACSNQCDFGVVSASVVAKYTAAIARAIADIPPLGFPQFCNCEFVLIPRCRSGRCDYWGSSLPEAPSACTDAGARCWPSTNFVCTTPGPEGGCAYSDEVCCFN